MSQAEYYKLQARQPFTSFQRFLGQRQASGNMTDTTLIGQNVMVVVVNQDTVNSIQATITQNSLVTVVVYYFPWFTYSFGTASGILFILLSTTLFALFIALITCILFDCLSSEEKKRKKKRRKLIISNKFS